MVYSSSEFLLPLGNFFSGSSLEAAGPASLATCMQGPVICLISPRRCHVFWNMLSGMFLAWMLSWLHSCTQSYQPRPQAKPGKSALWTRLCSQGSVFTGFDCRAIFVWPWKIVSVSVRHLFHKPMDEKIKTWTLRFPAKENLVWRRYFSIGQSCCSMTSKQRIHWFLESSRAWSFFTRAFA